LRFAYLLIFSNLYAHQILTQSYAYCNIRKYEVILSIVMQNTCIYIFSIKVDENIPYEKNPKTAISIQMSLNERY